MTKAQYELTKAAKRKASQDKKDERKKTVRLSNPFNRRRIIAIV